MVVKRMVTVINKPECSWVYSSWLTRLNKGLWTAGARNHFLCKPANTAVSSSTVLPWLFSLHFAAITDEAHTWERICRIRGQEQEHLVSSSAKILRSCLFLLCLHFCSAHTMLAFRPIAQSKRLLLNLFLSFYMAHSLIPKTLFLLFTWYNMEISQLSFYLSACLFLFLWLPHLPW